MVFGSLLERVTTQFRSQCRFTNAEGEQRQRRSRLCGEESVLPIQLYTKISAF
jgi:hypothetical protein